LAAEAPVLEQVGATLQQAGEPELGEFLVAQSENGKEEKEIFGYVLAHGFEKREQAVQARMEARLKERLQKLREHRERRAAPLEVTIVNSRQAWAVAKFATQQVTTRRGLYQAIMSCQPVGGLNLQPIQTFCAHEIEWANVELKYLGQFKAPGSRKSGVRIGKS